MTGHLPTAIRTEIIGDCTLYLGDCRDILPTLPKVDAVVTDPPYGIGEAAGKSHTRTVDRSRWRAGTTTDYGHAGWDNKPISDDLLAAVMSASRWQIIFGGNYYALPPSSCWLVWDKLNGDSDFADCEMAWTNLPKAVRRIQYMWHGFRRPKGESRGDHPTQKPIEVMRWCIGHLPDGCRTILDPFAGSGTTGVAAVKLGRSFIGIEREPKYFDIACRRIEAAYAQPDLFVSASPAPKPVQEALL